MVLFNDYYYFTTVTYLVRNKRVFYFEGYNNKGFVNLMTNIQRVFLSWEHANLWACSTSRKIELYIRHGIKEYSYYTPDNNISLKIHFNRNRYSLFKENKNRRNHLCWNYICLLIRKFMTQYLCQRFTLFYTLTHRPLSWFVFRWDNKQRDSITQGKHSYII